MTSSCSPYDLDDSLVITTTRPRSAVVVVRAVGEIDLLTAPGWRLVLLDALADGPERPERLVADLSTVTFLGVTGLDVLLDAADHARRAGTTLRVVAGTRRMRRVLHLLGVDRQLAVQDSLDEAVRGELPPAPAR